MADPKNSLIRKIRNTIGAPMLPGLREYLPQPMVLNLSRRAIYDFGREWQHDTKGDRFTEGKLDEFFKFISRRLNGEIYAFQKLMNEQAAQINEFVAKNKDTTGKTVGQWLRPQDHMDLTKAIAVFLVDSFAVCLATRSASDTGSFLEWFLGWTQQLLNYWPNDIRGDGANVFRGGVQDVEAVLRQEKNKRR